MKVSEALRAAAVNIELDVDENGGSYTEQERAAKIRAAQMIRDLAYSVADVGGRADNPTKVIADA